MSIRGRHALYPGTWNRNDPSEVAFLAVMHSLLLIGGGTGTSRINDLYTAASNAGLSLEAIWYHKSNGIHDPAVNPTTDLTTDFTALQAAGVLARTTYPAGAYVKNTFASPQWYYIDMLAAGVPDALVRWIDNQTTLARTMHARRALDGDYFDNASVLQSSFVTPGLPAGYTDAAWYAGIASFLAGMRTNLPGKRIHFNSYAGAAPVGLRGLSLLDSADGMFVEGFAWKITEGNPTPDFWTAARFRQHIDDVTTALAYDGGRTVTLLDIFQETNYARRLFALGAYLLAYNGTDNLKAGPRQVFGNSANVNYLVEYDEPINLLGTPTGAYTMSGQLMRRAYTGGQVIVNPDTSAANVTLSGRWLSLGISGGTAWNDATAATSWSGPLTGTVSVPAHTALILKPAPSGSTGVTTTHTLNHDGKTREFKMYEPAGLTGPAPVVFAWHPARTDDRFFLGEYPAPLGDPAQDIRPYADAFGYIVIFPNGTVKQPGDPSTELQFNALHCPGLVNPTDDVGFFLAMLGALPGLAEVDLASVYVMGFSNGAMMAQRLGDLHYDKIAAMGTVSGVLTSLPVDAGAAVPLLHIHGLADQVVSYNGEAADLLFPCDRSSVPNALASWAARNGCSTSPTTTAKTGYDILTYPGPVSTLLWKVTNGGHTYLPNPTSLYDTTAALFSFFQGKYLKPLAALTATVQSNPRQVSFSGEGSSDRNGVIEYSFDPGDGSGFQPYQSSSSLLYTYATPGVYTAQLKVRDASFVSRESAAASVTVTIADIPAVSLSGSPTSGLGPLTVSLSATAAGGVGGPYTYSFDYGEGAGFGPYSSTATPSHVYTSGGSYTIRVRVKDSAGQVSDPVSLTISVNRPPVINSVAATLNRLVATVTVSATDPDGGALQYRADFGAGGGWSSWQTSSSFSYTYPRGALYLALFQVRDALGATSSSFLKLLRPNRPPFAVLSNTASELTVTADASESSDPDDDAVEYRFDFGDGFGSYQSEPAAEHTYPVRGTYTVQLQVRDSEGEESEVVSDSVTVNQTPEAALSLSVSGLIVTADASGSSDPDGDTLEYRFDFGDGFGAWQSSPTAVHTYLASGLQTVRVQVRDDLLATSDAVSDTITTTNTAPTAELELTVDGLTITADASGSLDPDNFSLEYRFDFGDGFSSYRSSPSSSFRYETAGLKTVRVQVRDPGGLSSPVVSASATAIDDRPNQAPVADLDLHLGDDGLTVTADASDSQDPEGGNLEYRFDFGDGFGAWQSTSTAEHTYTVGGLKTVRAQVRDDQELESSIVTDTIRAVPVGTVTLSAAVIPKYVTTLGGTVQIRVFVKIGSTWEDGRAVVISTSSGAPTSLQVYTDAKGLATSYITFPATHLGTVLTVTATDVVSNTTTTLSIRTIASSEDVDVRLHIHPSRISFYLLPATVLFRAETVVDGAYAAGRILTFKAGDGSPPIEATTDENGIAVFRHTYSVGGPIAIAGQFVTVSVTDESGAATAAAIELSDDAPPFDLPDAPVASREVSSAFQQRGSIEGTALRTFIATNFDQVATDDVAAAEEIRLKSSSVSLLRQISLRDVRKDESHYDAAVAFFWAAYRLTDLSRLIEIQDAEKRSAWAAVLIDALSDLPEVFDGVLLDGGYLLRASDMEIGALPPDFDAAVYSAALTEIAEQVRDSLSVPVFVRGLSNQDPADQRVGAGFDGVVALGFALDDGELVSESDLSARLAELQTALNAGHSVTLVEQGTSTTARYTGLAAYLLIAGSGTAYTYSNPEISEPQFYPEHRLDLGAALDSVQIADGLYRRPFQNGKVLFNPSAGTKQHYVGKNTHLRLVLQGGGSWETIGLIRWEKITTDYVVLGPGEVAIIQPTAVFHRFQIERKLSLLQIQHQQRFT